MSENMIILIYNAFILLVLLVAQLLIPNVSRRNIFLGVKIPENKFETDEVKKIMKGYRLETGIVGLALLLLGPILGYKYPNEIFILASTLIYIGTLFLVYLRWNKKTKKLKKKMAWDNLGSNTVLIDTKLSREVEIEKLLDRKWMIIHLVIILANILLALYMYPSLGDKIPTNWDLAGNVNGWMNKSIWTVLLMPITQVFTVLVMYLVYYAMKRSKKQINPNNPEVSVRKNIKFIKVWGIYILITTIILQLMLSYGNMAILGLVSNMKTFTIITLLIAALMTVGAILIGVKVGQGGERLNLNDEGKAAGKYDIDDDKHWKLGNTIYYNREDPSVFVEKRVGIGWTVNVGTILGLVFLIAPVIIIIITILLI